MASHYSVIQYAPDPIADERINIGVFAFNAEQMKIRFSSNRGRLQLFAGLENFEFLHDFMVQVQDAVEGRFLLPGALNDTPQHERLMKYATAWLGGIQFTEPRGSLENVDTLLADMSRTFLHE